MEYKTHSHVRGNYRLQAYVSYLRAYYKSSIEFATLCGNVRCILRLARGLWKEWQFVRPGFQSPILETIGRLPLVKDYELVCVETE